MEVVVVVVVLVVDVVVVVVGGNCSISIVTTEPGDTGVAGLGDWLVTYPGS